MTNITSDLYITNNAASGKKLGNVLGKDDFLKLLIVQLQNQDPLNPMEDREFIAQMANFSSLEQMTNLNANMEGFIKQSMKQQLLAFQQYLGREITWQEVKVTDGENVVATKNGIAVSVSFEGDSAIFIMDDNSKVSMDHILKISQSGNAVNPSDYTFIQASQLIGNKVSLELDNKSFENLTVASVITKDGKIHFSVSDNSLTDQKFPIEAITKISK